MSNNDLKLLAKYLKVILIFYLVSMVFNILLSFFLNYFGIPVPLSTIERNGFLNEMLENKFLGTVILFFSALFEEVGFRLFPLMLFLLIFKTKKSFPVAAIVSTIIFGLLHGGGLFAYIAAAMGLIFFIGFYQAFKVEEDLKNATLVATMSHFLYNWTVFLLLVYK